MIFVISFSLYTHSFSHFNVNNCLLSSVINDMPEIFCKICRILKKSQGFEIKNCFLNYFLNFWTEKHVSFHMHLYGLTTSFSAVARRETAWYFWMRLVLVWNSDIVWESRRVKVNLAIQCSGSDLLVSVTVVLTSVSSDNAKSLGMTCGRLCRNPSIAPEE